MSRFSILRFLAALSIAALPMAGSLAADQQGKTKDESGTVYIVNQELKEFLREIARRDGYEISMTRKVRGQVKRVRLPVDTRKVLRKLSAQHDLKWYFQQNQLFVSTGSDNSTRLIYLGKMSNEEFQSAIDAAKLESSAFDTTYVEESNSVLINGPASYIANVELLVQAYNKDAKNRNDGVRVIRFGRVGS